MRVLGIHQYTTSKKVTIWKLEIEKNKQKFPKTWVRFAPICLLRFSAMPIFRVWSRDFLLSEEHSRKWKRGFWHDPPFCFFVFFLCLSFGRFRLRWGGPKGHLTSPNPSFFGVCLLGGGWVLGQVGPGEPQAQRRPLSCNFRGFWSFSGKSLFFRSFFFYLIFLALLLLLLFLFFIIIIIIIFFWILLFFFFFFFFFFIFFICFLLILLLFLLFSSSSYFPSYCFFFSSSSSSSASLFFPFKLPLSLFCLFLINPLWNTLVFFLNILCICLLSLLLLLSFMIPSDPFLKHPLLKINVLLFLGCFLRLRLSYLPFVVVLWSLF